MFLAVFSSEPTSLAITVDQVKVADFKQWPLTSAEIEANSTELRNIVFSCAIDRLGVVYITLCYVEIIVIVRNLKLFHFLK